MTTTMRTLARLTTLTTLTALAALALAAPAAGAQTLDFEGVPTNAAGFNATPLTALAGYQLENWGVLTTANPFGTGANASSGVKFGYGVAGAGSSYIYRTDVNFNLAGASLSFRTFDGNVTPVDIVVRGYNGPDELFTRTLTLANTAQQFALGFWNVEEVEFETAALDGTRSAVLAVDDVTLAAVPEPGTVLLVLPGIALLGAAAARRRRHG
jgi:hypothetical protein